MIDWSDPDLVFLHLSDLHFREGRSGDVHDEDKDIRNELERALRRVRSELGRIDGIIISGDIAFHGRALEYKIAKSWIESIREQLDCKEIPIMVIPGNHDVDRSAIPIDGDIDKLHKPIHDLTDNAARNDMLAAAMRHETNGPLLFKPLEAYIEFAKEYDCLISPKDPFWERKFYFRNGRILIFRGLTTTFISGERDDERTHKMVYGGAQLQLLRLENTSWAVIGHHPPSWTLEGDEADKVLSERTVLQFFGHKHDNWATKIGKSLRLIGGAMHPSRQERYWMPRFTILKLKAPLPTTIEVRLLPFRWTPDDGGSFIPDCDGLKRDYRDYTLDVDPLVPSPTKNSKFKQEAADLSTPTQETTV
jgi:hypothetical protein